MQSNFLLAASNRESQAPYTQLRRIKLFDCNYPQQTKAVRFLLTASNGKTQGKRSNCLIRQIVWHDHPAPKKGKSNGREAKGGLSGQVVQHSMAIGGGYNFLVPTWHLSRQLNVGRHLQNVLMCRTCWVAYAKHVFYVTIQILITLAVLLLLWCESVGSYVRPIKKLPAAQGFCAKKWPAADRFNHLWLSTR